ncbi:MAG TPA: hypothetical protein VHF05_03300 [Candidatus Paceibacterota bacterium]|nr:hypothetical protein [Candidatus Paceibacterota bacterium]
MTKFWFKSFIGAGGFSNMPQSSIGQSSAEADDVQALANALAKLSDHYSKSEDPKILCAVDTIDVSIEMLMRDENPDGFSGIARARVGAARIMNVS